MSEQRHSTRSDALRHRLGQVWTISMRELRTVLRSRGALVLAAAFVLVALGITYLGDGYERGYVPTIFDLLTPLELIVPIFAITLSYRSLLGDATRGELDILRSYRLAPSTHVIGTFLGLALFVTATIVIALMLAGVAIALTPPETVRVFATHEVADSPIFFARLVVLTVALGLVFLSIGLAISALASSTRTAVAVVGTVLLLVFVGFEFALVQGLEIGFLPDELVSTVLGLGPTSAFRGLVLETAVAIDPGAETAAASPIVSTFGLLGWIIFGIGIASLGLRTRD